MMQSPKIRLHVGYGKTGSTAIQVWLAQSPQSLKHLRIHYPIPPNGQGDSGNGHLLLEALNQPCPPPSWALPEGGSLLFSREHLARELSESATCEQLASSAERWGLNPIAVLLLVRDPQEHCYSLWAQKVKRAGERRSLHEFAEHYDAIAMATRFLAAARAAGMAVQVLDYGRHRRQLLASFQHWLSPSTAMEPMPPSAVPALTNPTPQHGQLRLQRHLHRLWPGGAAPVPSPRLARWLEPREGVVTFAPALRERWAKQVAGFNALCEQLAVPSEGMPCGSGQLRNQRGIRLG